MANLLDEASILLTPTAYNDGSMLAIKPENGDGDITFSRNSAATRVNAQELVENVQILSSDLVSNGDFSQEGAEQVTNGDFANSGTDWNLRDAWIVSNGICSLNPPNSDYLSQSNVLTSNKSYKLTFDIIVNSGSLQPQFYDSGFQTIGTYTTSQSVEVYFLSSSSGTLYFKPNSFDGSIDNVSIKEVGQDWTLGTGWSIGDDKATVDNTENANLDQSTLVNGKKYKVSFEISDLQVGGSVTIGDIVTPSAYTATSNGSQTFNYTATYSTLRVRGKGYSCSITDISVKEITDDTNLPRIDYTDGCGSWLLEQQSTNTITYSEDFSNSFYIKDSGVSLGSSNNTSPGGETNATQINVTDNGRIYANTTSNTYYTSVFIKAGTFSYFKFLTGNIDLVAKTNSNGSIEDYGNGWFRIGVAITSVRPFQIQAYPDGTYAPHTTAGSYYIWGAQLEVQSFATSYIPTSGATSTRLKDIATNSGNASLINSEQGVFYAEISSLADSGSFRLISLNNDLSNSSNNAITIGFSNGNNFYLRVVVNGTAILSSTNISATKNQYYKVAIKFNSLGDNAIWIDGVEVLSNTTSFTYPVIIDNLSFDYNGNGGLPFYGKTKALTVFKTALTDEQLTALTTI